MRWRLVALALLAWLVALAAVESASARPVATPRFVRNIDVGETGWFSSPGLVDLTGDGRKEIVAPFYSTFVFAANGRLLGRGTATEGRVYAPGVVADLDRDGVIEIVVGGNEGTVAAYNLSGTLRVKPGWPASTCSGGQCPEARGMAAADLDGNGSIETVVTTTTRRTAARRCSCSTRPAVCIARAGPHQRWPKVQRLQTQTFNGIGNHGYGAYGENVGIGNLDDDAQLEDHHHVRQPPDQRVQPRRHLRAGLGLVHEPREWTRRDGA